jgi:hypothetical protein
MVIHFSPPYPSTLARPTAGHQRPGEAGYPATTFGDGFSKTRKGFRIAGYSAFAGMLLTALVGMHNRSLAADRHCENPYSRTNLHCRQLDRKYNDEFRVATGFVSLLGLSALGLIGTHAAEERRHRKQRRPDA